MKKNIKIAGAGLSGLVAGINLVKEGFDVTIYEKRKEVGMRFNNDFQGIANWMSGVDVIEEFKKMNIEIDFLSRPFREIIIFGSSLKERTELKSDKPIFYLVKRGGKEDCLDYSLKKQFLIGGGKIEFEANVDLKEVDIIATGPEAPRVMAIGYVFDSDFRDIACGLIDNNVAPEGYAYLLVNNKKGTLATVLFRDFQNQHNYLNKTVDLFENKLGLRMENKKKFGGFGNFFFSHTAIKDGKVYLGEAAGFQDSFAGFGMVYAVRSGFLAAKSIMDNLDYNRLWKDSFNDLLKASLSNRLLFRITKDKSYQIMNKIAKHYQNDACGLIKKGYSFDWERKLVFPLAWLIEKFRMF